MTIEITDVSKSYGTVTALDGVSLEVPTGSTFGILGTNGAGKTTLFELLVGYDAPDSGHISVDGLDAGTAGGRVRELVGFLPEQVGFPGLLTGREVLELHGRIRNLGGETPSRIDEVLATVGLEDAADRRVGGYSNGMQTRLGLAAALLAEPPILVLDEPTAGLDPRGVESFHRLIERIGGGETTIVLSSHVLTEVERLCDEVAILHDGQLCAVGEVDGLIDAAGATTTVTITVPTDGAATRIVEAVSAHGSVSLGTHSVTVECASESVAAVIGAVEDDWMDRIEIATPGLGHVFHQAVASAEAADPQEVTL